MDFEAFLTNPNSLPDSLRQPGYDEIALSFLKDLVEIPSSTRNVEGVNKIQDRVESELKNLDFTTLRTPSDEEGFGSLLLGQLDHGHQRTVSLVFHADTVTEGSNGKPVFLFDHSQGLASGPGIADDKAGIVIALSGLKQFLENNEPRFNIQVISSPNEELGSKGLCQKLRNLGSRSWMCLGFEPALDNGSIISSRHGNRWYEFSIKGREAHSGRANGEEINAAHEFAAKVVKLMALKKKYPNVKINIGSVRSDKDVFNIVCGRIKAKVDLRFETNHDRDHLTHDVLEILKTPTVTSKTGEAPEVLWELADDCPSFSNCDKSIPFVKMMANIISQAEGRDIRDQHSGGASDLNHVTPDGAIAIDGLGAVGGLIHTNKEFIHVDSLSTRSRSLSFFLSQINQTP